MVAITQGEYAEGKGDGGGNSLEHTPFKQLAEKKQPRKDTERLELGAELGKSVSWRSDE